MNDLLKNISIKRLEAIAYGSVRQSAEEGVMLARFALENLRGMDLDSPLVSQTRLLVSHGYHWSDAFKLIAKINNWIVVTHGFVVLVVAPDEQAKEALEIAREVFPVTHKVYVGAGSLPWVEGRDIPSRASQACYETGAGKAINALVEVDKALQDQGWPALGWAYLDVVPGVMICRSTNQNITSHVVRWLPVRVEGM